jgi:hypothetical protein
MNNSIHVPLDACELGCFVHEAFNGLLDFGIVSVQGRAPEAPLDVQISFPLPTFRGARALSQDTASLQLLEQGTDPVHLVRC